MAIDVRIEKHISYDGCRREANSLHFQSEGLSFLLSNVKNLMYIKPYTTEWDPFYDSSTSVWRLFIYI